MAFQYDKHRDRSLARSAEGEGFSAPGAQLPNSVMMEMMGGTPEQEADRLSEGVTAESPSGVRSEMGSRLGADFSSVRFHTDEDSADRADAMGAEAWTEGSDVYFGSGGFSPSVAAHELVHTVQQGAVAGRTSASVPYGTVQKKTKRLELIEKMNRVENGSLFGESSPEATSMGRLFATKTGAKLYDEINGALKSLMKYAGVADPTLLVYQERVRFLAMAAGKNVGTLQVLRGILREPCTTKPEMRARAGEFKELLRMIKDVVGKQELQKTVRDMGMPPEMLKKEARWTLELAQQETAAQQAVAQEAAAQQAAAQEAPVQEAPAQELPPQNEVPQPEPGAPQAEQQAPQAQAPEGEWNFEPEAYKKRSKPSVGRVLHDDLTHGAGKLTKTVVNTGSFFILAPYKLHAAYKLLDAEGKMQEYRDKSSIPGWNGAKYRKNRAGDDIMADFRRVPTVWSRATPGKAEDDRGQPLSPEITVYFHQPKAGSSRSLQGMEMGHAMIGIRYTRFSRMTGKNQRYALKYGFYPAGGFMNTAGMSVSAVRDAVVPGQLVDDWSHDYSISRTYPATAKQAGDIIRASENYAEGGYGYFDRNCTTFVKNMVVDVAHLDTGGIIFEQERVRFNALENTLRWGGTGIGSYLEADFKKQLAERSKQDDLSYQGYGNKRVTMQDVENYRSTSKSAGKFVKKAFIPGVSGENLRRLTGKGMLGSLEYMGNFGDSLASAAVSLEGLETALDDETMLLKDKIMEILPEHYRDPGNMPEGFREFIFEIQSVSLPVNRLNKLYAKYVEDHHTTYAECEPEQALTAEQLTTAYQEIERIHAALVRDLDTWLKGDARLDKQVTNALSMINLTRHFIENIYESVQKNAAAQGDLGDIREEMYRKKYQVKAGEEEASFTPSLYEAYLQVYKTPEQAVHARKRYVELKEKNSALGEEGREAAKKSGKGSSERVYLRGREKSEYMKLQRLHDLAEDFDSAHRYLLEKDGFSQQDIDYAFALGVTEKKQDAESGMLEQGASAAGIYQSLFLEKVFGGMRSAFLGQAEGVLEGQLAPLRGGGAGAAGRTGFRGFLDQYLNGCVERKSAGMKMILRGMRRADGALDAVSMRQAFARMLADGYLDRAFSGSDEKLALAGNNASLALYELMADPAAAFTRRITALIAEVMAEGQNG